MTIVFPALYLVIDLHFANFVIINCLMIYALFSMEDNKFLAVGKDYRQLIVYRKTECVYDITFFFANKF